MNAPPFRPRLITFGCRLNSFESETIRENAEIGDDRETIVVNTCTVTAEAVRQARQAIRRARRETPDARIVVTGCAAQVEPELFAAMPEVDLVLGNREKLAPENFHVETVGKTKVGDIMARGAIPSTGALPIDGFEGRARAFLRVQNGCDHRCTFCIIPFARGASESVPPEAAIRQAKRLVANGYPEIVLSGVDLTSFGADLPERPSLAGLIEAMLREVPGLLRLRLSSIDVIEIGEDLLRLIANEPRILPHLHLSLQAGDDMILKRMKRRHSRADAIRFCGELRDLRPDFAFGADLIAGFPTETDAMFENTLDLVEACGLAFLHVFPYSPRAGTPAAKMPQLPLALRKARAARLRAAGEAALAAFLAKQVGRTVSVLVESVDADGLARGRSEHYAPVAIRGAGRPGEIVAARVSELRDGVLFGETA